MKPPPFEYARPTTLKHALQLLHDNADDAKLLAGGQSLVPTMNFRLASPRLLIDINAISGLDTITSTPGDLRIGAMTRWYQVKNNPLVLAEFPILARAIDDIAHYPIRNRGTLGGSCAHADPAAELPAVLLACDGTLVLRSLNGERTVAAAQFFQGALDTILTPDEMIVEIRVPKWPQGRRWAFEEFARRRGDFALAGMATVMDMSPDGTCARARLVAFGVGEKAAALPRTEAFLLGKKITPETVSAAAESAQEEVDARADVHASAPYRKALIALLAKQTISRIVGLESMEVW